MSASFSKPLIHCHRAPTEGPPASINSRLLSRRVFGWASCSWRFASQHAGPRLLTAGTTLPFPRELFGAGRHVGVAYSCLVARVLQLSPTRCTPPRRLGGGKKARVFFSGGMAAAALPPDLFGATLATPLTVGSSFSSFTYVTSAFGGVPKTSCSSPGGSGPVAETRAASTCWRCFRLA